METIEFAWQKQYPANIPLEVQSPYKSLVELLEKSVKNFGPLPAFDCMGASLSYNAIDKLTQDFAAFLQKELGLSPGDRIALQLPNILQYPIAMLGALRAGLVVVNVNPLYTTREMKHQLADSGASTIVILANFAANLEKVLPDTAIENVIITEIGDQLGGLKKIAVNVAVRHLKKMVPEYHLPEAIPFNLALKKGEKHSFKQINLRSQDTAFLQYTGGTTGVSKGAVLSHGNILANVAQFSVWLSPAKLDIGKEIIITAMPLYHIMALMGNCFMGMEIGGRNVLIPNPRDLKKFIREMKKYRFSLFSGVNTLYNALLNHPDFSSLDFSYLKFCGAGGMAIQSAVATKWEHATGVAITEGYGLTETSPILTFNVPGRERIGTIGLPVPGTRMMIMDEDGQEVPVGQAGEIYARGPQIMREYWNQPDETGKVFNSSGWFKTGDMGVMEENGFFRIVDRKKEMILVSGFNVYPNEIEEVVSSHEKVREVGAVGIPDERSTEAVKIFVVKKDTSLTEEELRIYCKENLTAYKCPKEIEFREELPKSNIGKILRRILKEEPELEQHL